MGRRAARVDQNQREIAAALRKVGASVQHLHTVGKGCPDLLVGIRGRNLLMEVKMPNEDLNQEQQDWRLMWMGQSCIVRSPAEAIAAAAIMGQP